MGIVKLTIGERQFEVAPLKLKQLRQMAPFIEDMNRIAKAIESDGPEATRLFELSRTLCEIIGVAVSRIDPAMDADTIEDTVDLSFMPSLQAAVRALLEQSGFAMSGEASPPLESGQPTGDSQASLPESSANSSPQE